MQSNHQNYDEVPDLEMGVAIDTTQLGFSSKTPETKPANQDEIMIDTVITSVSDKPVQNSAEKSTEKLKEQSKPLDVMKMKDIQTTHSLFNPENNEKTNENYLRLEEILQPTPLETAIKLAESIANLIKQKIEPIQALSYYNRLLEENQQQLIHVIANLTVEARQQSIKVMFLDLVKLTQKEIVITKHEYLYQIFLFFRNCVVNYFGPLIKETQMCSVIDEILNQHSSLIKSLSDSSNMQNHMKVGFNKITNKRDWLNSISSDIKQNARNQENWRAELKKGDYIDAINLYETNQNPNTKFVAGWSPAKIVMADNQDYLLVSFLRCPIKTQQKLLRSSDRIAPYGKYTDNWNWRFNIEEDTVFDCCDEYGNWYRSTCLKKSEDDSIVDIDGNSIPQLIVAFRCLDPNGIKQDDKQRNVTGWISAKYDTEMWLAQPNIQPLNNLTFQYFDVGQGKMVYDIQTQDIDDIIYPSSTIQQWATRRDGQFAGLQFFADILNEFGEFGGFELILEVFEQIAIGDFDTSIAHFLTLHQILRKTLPLWTRQFLCHYIPLVQTAFERVITQEKSSVLKQCEKDTFSGLVENFKDLMKRNNTNKRIQQMANTLNIKIGGVLLKSTNLPKRIQGIKMLSDEVRTARHSGTMISREVMQDLLNADILQLIFSPQKFHLQIVQRSQEIIKLYASEKQLTQQHLDMMWEATLVDETALIEVYNIIKETSQILPDSIIEQFICKIRDQMDPQKVTIREVDFVHQIGKNAYAKSSARQSAYNVLWSIFMMERSGYSKHLLKQSRKHFYDLLRNADRELIELHIQMAIEIIQSGKGANVQALKIIIKLVETLPKYVYQNSVGRSLSRFLAETQENYQLIDSILDNLEKYLNGELIDEGYNHQKNVHNRLKAIKFILENVDDKKTLTANQVERAWNILFNQSSDDNDAVLLFDWFSQVLNNQEWVQYNTNVICNIFQQYVLNNTHKLLSQGVHSNAFQCIQTLFLVVNENQNLINVLTRNTNANLIDKSKRQKPTFRVNVLPKQLIGIEIIWQFFVSSCYKRDNELQQNVIGFLTQLYLSQSNFLESKKQEIYQEFTEECLRQMDSVLDQNDVLPSEKAEITKNSMQIFLSFFEECEKKGGTANIRPHAALDSQVYYIENLLVTSYLNEKSQPKYLLLNLPSNMTLWELIDYLAKKLNKSPLRIQIKRERKDKQELTANDYCKSLRMLSFESNEELMIMKQQVSFNKVPLINPLSGLLVQEAQQIFTSWFNRYSVPAEEVKDLDLTKSPTAERYMTKETATEFLQHALISQSSVGYQMDLKPDDKRITKLFQENDLDHDDLLTLEDFLRFYRHSSHQKPEVVWSNLQSFCYGQDLTPELRGEITYTNDPNLTVDQNSLPRSQIAENLEYLEKLFAIETEDVRTQEKIWQLISSLKTNSSIYQQVFSSTNLNQLFDPNQPVLKLLYNLQIAKHFLQQETAQRIAMQPIAKLYIEKGKEIAGSSNYLKDFPKIGDAVEDGEQGFQSASQTRGKSSQVLGAISETNEEPERINFKNLGAGSHWEKPQAAVSSDTVIALPAAEFPQDQQQDAAAANNTKLSYNQQQIAGWKGQIIYENAPFPSYCVKNESIWLVQFLENKGFQILVQLLEFFVKNNELKSHAQKNCVKQITQMIKIILMVTLAANSDNQELTNTLVRKMSSQEASVSQNAQQQDSKKSQENEEFFMLIEQVKLYEVSHMDLLENDPEMNQIQQLLQSTFQAILKNKQTSSEEERAIVSDCLNIWINLITFKTNQILILYNDEGYINLLIEQGLLAENVMMRTQFKEAIEFISFQIKHEGLSMSPARFFLNVLVGKLQHISDNIHSNRTAQYFTLTNNLLSVYFAHRRIALQFPHVEFTDLCDHKGLIVQGLELLNRLKVQEARLNGLPDNTLVGLLQFVKIILINEKPDLLIDEERFIVLTMLIEKCLFSKNTSTITNHITKDVNIQEISQSNMNKCYSKESREAAYSLLQSVIGDNPNPEMLTRLIKNFWAPLIMKLEKPIENQLAPSERKRSSFGFAGMKNLGCICYMNSMIQQLYHVPAFRYLLMAADDQQPMNIVKRPNGKEIDDNNLHQWMRMFGFLELTERQDYNPDDFCYSFKNGDQPTNVRVQQDAQEFLNVAFDRLESSLKDTPMKNLCQSVFQGQNSSLMICKSCGNVSQRDEDFYCVQVQVKNQKDIYTSLKSMVAGEVIQGYKCSSCNQTVDIEKKWALKKLPNFLIVHLNRIVFDFDQMINIKLNDRFEFPNVLSMKDYMIEEILKEVKAQNLQIIKKKDPIDEEDFKDNDDENNYVQEDQNMVNEEEKPADLNEKEVPVQQTEEYQYKLVGVVIHMGSANAGHYLSYINIERERDPKIDPAEWLKTEHQNWLEFNDSTVKPFDFSQLAYKCFGELQSSTKNIITSQNYQNDEAMTNSATTAQAAHNAYMLVYEKQIKSDISIVLDERTVETIQQNSVSLACDGTTIPRAIEQPHSCIVYPQLSEKVLAEQLAPNSTIQIPFYDVQKFVPNSIYKQISEDNQIYTAELQVYDNHFFKTTTQLLTSLIEMKDSPQLLNDIYIVIDKLIFDLLFNQNQNKELPQLCKLLFTLTNKQPVLLAKLVQDRILYKEKLQGATSEYPFFEILLFHKDQEIRETAEYILTQVTSIFFENLEYHNARDLFEDQIEQLQQGLNTIIEISLSFLNNQNQLTWHKIGAYLNYFYNILKDKQWSRYITFNKKHLVLKLVELISKYKDIVSNGAHFSNPPFENAIKTISLMVRAQPILIHLYKIPIEHQVTVEEYTQLLEESEPSPFHRPINNQTLFLDPEDIKCLFMADKKSKNFWEICINFSYTQETREEVSQLIQHVCYKNYDLSKRIAKIMIFGLNRTNADDIKPYAVCMEGFLSIPDQFQRVRIEWLLGMPSITMNRPQNSHYYSEDYRPQIHKIGVGNITDVADCIHDYNNPFLKDQGNTSESVLKILYKYRKSGFQEVVLVLIEYLLKAITNDRTGNLLDFLLIIEGPSYTCANYWDWIEPFITQLIQDNYAGSNQQQQLMEICFRIFGSITKIKEDNKEKLADKNKKEPYLIWSITGSEEMRTIINHNKNFHVVISELKTQISNSTPNPSNWSNENLTKITRGGWQSTFELQAPTRKHHVSPKQTTSSSISISYGRGKKIQNRPNLTKVYTHKNSGMEIEDVNGNEDENENFPQEEPLPKITIHNTASDEQQPLLQNQASQDIGDNWSDKNNNGSDDDGGGQIKNVNLNNGFFNDDNIVIETKAKQDGNLALNQSKSQDSTGYQLDHQLTSQLDQALDNQNSPIPEEKLLFTSDNENDPIVVIPPPQEDNMDFEQIQPNYNNYLQDDQPEEEKIEPEVQDDVPRKTLEGTVLQITLRNFHKTKIQKCTLIFDQPETANYYVPHSEFSCSVNTTTDQTYSRLMKLRPHEPWGEISLRFLVDGEDLDGHDQRLRYNWPQFRVLREGMLPAEQEVAPPLITSVPFPPETPAIPDGEVSCSICTFFNSQTANYCEMCGQPL